MSTLVVEKSGAYRQAIAGWLIFFSVLVYTISIVYPGAILYLCGALYWLALFCVFPDVQGRSKKQVRFILICSLPGILLSIYQLNADPFQKALVSNAGIITLLMVVGLFGLSSHSEPKSNINKAFGSGPKFLISTYANVHFIGAIINYAAVIIFGDRLHKIQPLNIHQATLLSRAFASAGFWSPLFVTMAVASTYSPNFDFIAVLPLGLAVAMSGFLYTMIEYRIKGRLDNFLGLGTSVQSMMLPIGVAIVIGVLVYLFPTASIINIVILTALAFGVFHFSTKKYAIVNYVQKRLPKHHNEIALFLSAGALNASLMGVIYCFSDQIDLLRLSPMLCVAFMASAMALNMIGVHPLISITLFAGIVDIENTKPNMLAFTLFSTWAICSALGPLSGQNIGLASRYSRDSMAIAKNNILFSLTLFSICSMFIFLLCDRL
ncbi:MAG: hypothetical protein OXE99_13935 [Cellvibrionales bacterium]|nr:hypothetical protein [Cellvibrionales bacterium]